MSQCGVAEMGGKRLGVKQARSPPQQQSIITSTAQGELVAARVQNSAGKR